MAGRRQAAQLEVHGLLTDAHWAFLRKRWPIVLPLLLGFGWLQWYVTCVHPDVAYMDTLRLLHQNQAYSEGRLSLFDLWNQGQHRGLLFQALLALNVRWLDLDVLLADRLTPLMIVLQAGLLCLAFRRELPRPGAGVAWAGPGFYLVCAALLCSLAGWELYILDLGLAQHLKNLLFVGYFIGFDAYLRQARPAFVAGLGLAIAGIVLVGFIGMGWSYSFLLATTAMLVRQALHRRAQGWRWILPAMLPWVVMATALVVSVLIAGGIGNSGESGPSWFAERLHDAGIVKGLLLSLGTSVLGVEMVSARPTLLPVALTIGAGVLVAALVALLARWRDRRDDVSAVPVALIVYGLSFAVSIALARGFGDPFMAAASRYYMDNVLTLVGIAWCAFDRLAVSSLNLRAPRQAALLTAGAVLLLGVAATNADEWRKAKWRLEAFQHMHAVALAGIETPEQAQTLQAPFADAQAGVALQQARLLGVYAPFARGCDAPKIEKLSGWSGAGGDEIVDRAVFLASPCHCGVRLDGNVSAESPPQQVVIERDGRVLQTLSLRPGEPFAVRVPGWEAGAGRIAIRRLASTPGRLVAHITAGCP